MAVSQEAMREHIEIDMRNRNGRGGIDAILTVWDGDSGLAGFGHHWQYVIRGDGTSVLGSARNLVHLVNLVFCNLDHFTLTNYDEFASFILTNYDG